MSLLQKVLCDVGIDWAAETHAVCVMDAHGRIRAQFMIGHADDPAGAHPDRETGGQDVGHGPWLALGGGGYSLVRVVPRSWTHLLAIVSGRDIDPATPLPEEWLALAAAARPGIAVPVDMSDGVPNPVTFQPWEGTVELAVDRAIRDTRSVVYPPHGLDAHDPRD